MLNPELNYFLPVMNLTMRSQRDRLVDVDVLVGVLAVRVRVVSERMVENPSVFPEADILTL